jgi:hypothetical protein
VRVLELSALCWASLPPLTRFWLRLFPAADGGFHALVSVESVAEESRGQLTELQTRLTERNGRIQDLIQRAKDSKSLLEEEFITQLSVLQTTKDNQVSPPPVLCTSW